MLESWEAAAGFLRLHGDGKAKDLEAAAKFVSLREAIKPGSGAADS
jgi:hypothetical protein